MKNHYRRIYDREKFLGPLNDLTDNMCHKFQGDLWQFEFPSHFEAPLAHQHIWSFVNNANVPGKSMCILDVYMGGKKKENVISCVDLFQHNVDSNSLTQSN